MHTSEEVPLSTIESRKQSRNRFFGVVSSMSPVQLKFWFAHKPLQSLAKRLLTLASRECWELASGDCAKRWLQRSFWQECIESWKSWSSWNRSSCPSIQKLQSPTHSWETRDACQTKLDRKLHHPK